MQRQRAQLLAGFVGLVIVGLVGLRATDFLSSSSTTAVQRRRLGENSGSECLKEAQCPQQSSCGPQIPSDSLPFSVSYSKTPSSDATQFTFQVCSTECASAASCKPLERFLLRLDSNLLANSEFFKTVSPAGSFSQCSEAASMGYSWSGNQLGALQFHDPAQGEVCQDFTMEIYHESEAFSNLWLTDICQQGVKYIDANGLLSEPQSSLADTGSCIARLSLDNGATGIKLLADEDFNRPIEPPTDAELKTEIHRVMAELEAPRRRLLQTGSYSPSYGYGGYGYYSSPTPAPPAYGTLFGPPAPKTPSYAPAPAYGYSPPSYGYSYGSYGSYGYAPPTAPTPSTSTASAPSVTLFGPLTG